MRWRQDRKGRYRVAYARWDRHSRYYIFAFACQEQADLPARPREGARLAIWHQDHSRGGPGTEFTYLQVRRVLETDDFTPIAGFVPSDADFLRPLLQEFIHDVDADTE